MVTSNLNHLALLLVLFFTCLCTKVHSIADARSSQSMLKQRYGHLGLRIMQGVGISTGVLLRTSDANAALSVTGQDRGSSDFQRLLKRASSADSMRVDPGVLSADVVYPSWFEGVWDSASTTRNVYGPIGIDLFGGESMWQKAQKDVGSTINYKSKFMKVPTGDDKGEQQVVIADRLFNIAAIADSAVGKGSVFDLSEQNVRAPAVPTTKYYEILANQIKVAISPRAVEGDIFDVVLSTIDRQAVSAENPDEFACLEKSVQAISLRIESLAIKRAPPPPRIKEIETITVYKKVYDDDISSASSAGESSSNSNQVRQGRKYHIEATQRTATFLTSRDRSAKYRQLLEREPRIATNCIDIREYTVTYTKTD